LYKKGNHGARKEEEPHSTEKRKAEKNGLSWTAQGTLNTRKDRDRVNHETHQTDEREQEDEEGIARKTHEEPHKN
jgi:hypothetical protein